jgi:hypothetical protein
MHYFTLFVLALFALLSGIVVRKKSLLLKLNPRLSDYLTSVEDVWTWVTNDGRSYENAEIEQIEGDEIVLKHRLGISRLMVSDLSDESLQRLYNTSFWHNHDEPGSCSDVNFQSIHPEKVSADENLRAA